MHARSVPIDLTLMFKQSMASIERDFLVPEVTTGHRRRVVLFEESAWRNFDFATQNPKRTFSNFLRSLNTFFLTKYHATPILQGRYLEKLNSTTI